MSQETDKKPENFDWVTARSSCSIGVFFERLRNQVKDDVALRNASNPGKFYTFQFVDAGSNCFSAIVEGQLINRAVVRFSLNENNISISSIDHGGENDIAVTVTLGEDGECRAKIRDRVYDLWQVRKITLEDLFFRAR